MNRAKTPEKQTPVELRQLVPLMEEVFAQGGTFPFAPSGRSMLPMLCEGRDSVRVCSPAARPPRKYEVVLYRRESGKFVLHRIVGRDGDGFLLCGDRQFVPEAGVRADQIVAVLCAFTRRGRECSADSRVYRLYAVGWTALRPLRGLIVRAARRLRRKNGKGGDGNG